MAQKEQRGFIGLGYNDHRNERNKAVATQTLDPSAPLFIDFNQKEHTMIVAKSGFGKSYLAGVIAEENIRAIKDSALIMFDRMGIFSTLDLPGDKDEIAKWNQKLPTGFYHVSAQGMPNIRVWIPLSEQANYSSDMYYSTFSVKPSQLSKYSFCYTFSIGMSDPQANLYQKAHNELKKKQADFSLADLAQFVEEHGQEWHFKPQSVDALLQKLEALNELEVLSTEGTELSDMIQRNSIVVVDISNSDEKTACLFVNLLMERIVRERSRISKMIKMAQRRGKKVFIPNFIPNCHIIVDEAHNFLPRNEIFSKVIKEGRNIGLKITAISQSPDLVDDLYANISHLFVGLMNFEKHIKFLKGILPTDEKVSSFVDQVKSLERGCFLYYNLKDKTKQRIRIRPRQTLHTASTEIGDESEFMLNQPSEVQKPKSAVKHPHNGEMVDPLVENLDESPEETDRERIENEKLGWDDEETQQITTVEPEFKIDGKETVSLKFLPNNATDEECFSTLVLPTQISTIDVDHEIVLLMNKFQIGNALVIMIIQKPVSEFPSEFLTRFCNCKTRGEALSRLVELMGVDSLGEKDELVVLRLKWVKKLLITQPLLAKV